MNYNTGHLLVDCFNALRAASEGISLQICLIDNASTDGAYNDPSSKSSVDHLIVNSKNVGFGRATNQCLPLVDSQYVLLLNPDAFVSKETLAKTLEYMAITPECGVLGVKLVDRDGNLQPSCRYFPTPWNSFLNRTGFHKLLPNAKLIDDMTWDHASIRKCDWVPGCYYLTRREVINQVGLFDPRYFLYYEEIDHCYAVKKAGWEVHYYPYTEVIHLGGESAKSEGEVTESGKQIYALRIESELLYFRKNLGLGAVLINTILQTASNLMLPTKRLIKLRYPFYYRNGLSRSKILWQLFIRTRLASQPTK